MGRRLFKSQGEVCLSDRCTEGCLGPFSGIVTVHFRREFQSPQKQPLLIKPSAQPAAFLQSYKGHQNHHSVYSDQVVSYLVLDNRLINGYQPGHALFWDNRGLDYHSMHTSFIWNHLSIALFNVLCKFNEPETFLKHSGESICAIIPCKFHWSVFPSVVVI